MDDSRKNGLWTDFAMLSWRFVPLYAGAFIALFAIVTSGAKVAADAPRFVPATSPPYANVNSFASLPTRVGRSKPPAILTIPARGGALHPAAVLIGQGLPGDMNYTFGPNRIFKDIAEGLSSHGIAVIRYDTYLPGPSIQVHDQKFRRERIEDAVAAIDQLRHRSEVNPKRIFLIGHGEGAMLLPDIARAADGVAGFVLLAPPGRPPLDQVVAGLRALGYPREVIRRMQKLRDDIAAGTRSPDEIVQVTTINGLYPATVRYLADREHQDEFAVVRNLHEPILILHGGRDYQVSEAEIAAWRSHLKGAPKLTFREFPSLNRLFVKIGPPPSAPDRSSVRSHHRPSPIVEHYYHQGHVAQDVIDTIVSFVENPAGASE
jgi:dienelactone hydrolase